MTLFEYVSVAISIVLALGLGRLASSLPAVFASGRRDWLHANFVVLIGFTHLLMWWNLWRLREVATWNFLQFLMVMGIPITLSCAAHVLVSEPEGASPSWRVRLAEMHRWFFGALVVNLVFTVLVSSFVQSDYVSPAALLSGLTVVLGAALPDRRVHAAVGVLAWLLVAMLARRSFVAGPY